MFGDVSGKLKALVFGIVADTIRKEGMACSATRPGFEAWLDEDLGSETYLVLELVRQLAESQVHRQAERT